MNGEKAFGVVASHVSHALKPREETFERTDVRVVRALASMAQSCRHGRAIASNTLASIRRQREEATEELKETLRDYDIGTEPTEDFWRRVTDLLHRGADPDVTVQPYDLSVLRLGVRFEVLEVVDVALAGGANPNTGNSDNGFTVLMAAAREGHVEVVDRLLKANANPDMRDNYGKTALMFASLEKHEHVVAQLLEANADPNLPDGPGWTALAYASMVEAEQVVARLLEANADPNLPDGAGWGALMNAVPSRFFDIERVQELVVAGGLGLPPPPSAPDRIVDLLLDAGADPNGKNKLGETALMRAGVGGYERIVSRLLERGADPNVKNEQGNTAMMETSASIEYLLRYHPLGPSIVESGVYARIVGTLRGDGAT